MQTQHIYLIIYGITGDDVEIRKEAIVALSKLGDPEKLIDTAFRMARSDEDFARRDRAVEALKILKAELLAGGPRRELRFEFTDGSVITGRLGAKVVTVRIEGGGVMRVPVEALIQLDVGVNDRGGLGRRVESMVRALDSSSTRQRAQRGLIELGPCVSRMVRRHADSDIPSRRTAVAKILKVYERWSADHPDAPEATVRPLELQSKIQAGKDTFVGTITVREFRIDSLSGRVTARLREVCRIRPAESRTAPAATNKLGRIVVKLRDGTDLRGTVIGQPLRIETRYGIIAVPFKHIRKATFGPDGRYIRIYYRNSDRIAGSLDPRSKISLKTDRGTVEVSVGKIAEAAYGPVSKRRK